MKLVLTPSRWAQTFTMPTFCRGQAWISAARADRALESLFEELQPLMAQVVYCLQGREAGATEVRSARIYPNSAALDAAEHLPNTPTTWLVVGQVQSEPGDVRVFLAPVAVDGTPGTSMFLLDLNDDPRDRGEPFPDVDDDDLPF